MNVYNYQETTKGVKEIFEKHPSLVARFGEIDDFSNNVHADIYNAFYEFCQKNLTEECNEFNITPAYFYYTKIPKFNAFASEYNIIGVNSLVIEELGTFFLSKNIFREKDELVDYRELDDNLMSLAQKNLCYLMFQSFNQYLYYHELGHLIQYSNKKKLGIKNALNSTSFESYLNEGPSFNLEKHLMEIDADTHGANKIVNHILDFYDELQPKLKNEESLYKLISISISSLFSYWMYLSSYKSRKVLEIYFKDSTHPHPVIRVSFMISIMFDLLKKNVSFNFNGRRVIDESFKISNILFGYNIDEIYKTMLYDNLPEIVSYTKEMLEKSVNYPFLLANTIHKNMP